MLESVSTHNCSQVHRVFFSSGPIELCFFTLKSRALELLVKFVIVGDVFCRDIGIYSVAGEQG